MSNAPPLATHRGTQPDLILHWNDMPVVPDSVDVVVHLHGFSRRGAAMQLDRDIEPESGVDLAPPGGGTGRTRPTLGIVPRGSHVSGSRYEFPAFDLRAGFTALVDDALARFAAAAGVPAVARDRLIVTAHSGGGKALRAVLGHSDPDEVLVYDALYWSADTLIVWAQRRVARGAGAGATGLPGACRVLFTDPPPPVTGTRTQSEQVQRALRRALAAAGPAGAALAPRYRVELTSVAHSALPRTYGWRLLADAGAALPRTSPP